MYAFICCLVQEKTTIISNIEEIVAHEILERPDNKYGLTNVSNAEFLRQGFRIEEKYYLYSIFIDTSIGGPTDTIPYTIRIIKNEANPVEIYLRCDENLGVPFSEMIYTATTDAQKFHGITVDFAAIQSLEFQKEIIVHIHPETMHKILLMVNPGSESDGKRFFHVEIEELWNPTLIKDRIVTTNYIHAKYYPEFRMVQSRRFFNKPVFNRNLFSKIQ